MPTPKNKANPITKKQPKKKPITQKYLTARIEWANESIQLLLDDKIEVNKYLVALESGTTPPGEGPKNPPGIPNPPKP